MTGRVLNLGCGNRHLPGAVNVDITSRTSPDVVHDLDVRPWPVPDDHFDRVVAQDVIEHLHDVVKTMEEIHRIHYFTGEHEFAFYTDRHFARTRSDLVFRPTVVNKIVWRLAARWPDAYGQRWAWLFPAWFLSVELRVVKS